MKKLAPILVALAAAAAAQGAFAQQAKPAAEIEYRQSAFIVMARSFGLLGAMANDKMPYDAKKAAEAADVLAVVHPLPFTAFGPGTDKGAKTEAKPVIWQKTDEFNRDTEAMKTEMPKLVAAARSGDPAALKAAFGPTGKTCKTCHDSFKEK
jgi:cytochrome c556